MIWSATVGTFGELLVTRLLLGGVTAAAGPLVASLVGDYFAASERGRIYGYILAGELAGAGVGFAVTGDIAALSWRAAFVVGLVAAPIAYALFAAVPALEIDASYAMLVIAGLLVGIGTRYGAGCTSGHGVCGISRLSPRSLVATAVFMAAGFATVLVLRHLLAA
jgi:uncharacterized membrane protein YedE/YeeE